MLAVATIVENYRSAAAGTPSRQSGRSLKSILKGPMAAARAKRAQARAAHADIIGPMRELREHGVTFARIADALNRDGRLTSRGCVWDGANVRRVIEHYAD